MPLIDRQWYSYNIDLRDNLVETKKKLPSKEAVKALCDSKTVYLISMVEPFCVSYNRSASNVVYIGSGAAWNRIDQGHKKWMSALSEKLGISFKVSVSCPRVKKASSAYRHVEGDLIRKFRDHFGDYPLINSQQAYQTNGYEYSESYLDQLISPLSERYYAALSIFKGQVFSGIDLASIAK